MSKITHFYEIQYLQSGDFSLPPVRRMMLEEIADKVWDDENYTYATISKDKHISEGIWDSAYLMTDTETGVQWGHKLKLYRINPSHYPELAEMNKKFGTSYDENTILANG
jgi:hypothetical protein